MFVFESIGYILVAGLLVGVPLAMVAYGIYVWFARGTAPEANQDEALEVDDLSVNEPGKFEQPPGQPRPVSDEEKRAA